MSSLAITTSDAGASSAHAPVHMPNVVGLTRAQVYATMKAAQLFFRTQGPASSDGRWVSVAREQPAAGTLVPWRSTVTLTTSLSLAHAARRVPHLVGLGRARVYAAMKAAQLFFRTKGPGSTSGRWLAVARQSPAAGTLVSWHATVTLTTALRVPHPKRRVPRLIGLTRARASALMASTQLVLRSQGAGASNDSWASVVRQSPAPGTLVAWHSVVVATVTKPATRPVATTFVSTTNSTTTGSTTSSTTSSTTTSSTTTTTYPGEITTPTTTTTTTTTTTPVTTTTRVPSRANDYRVGTATWYAYTPGHCATWFLPYGTRITVRDLATGRAVVCIVTDKESARGDRVVDLSRAQFAQLAPLAKGVIQVRVSW